MIKTVSFVQPNFQQGPKELNAFYLPYSAGVILAYALEHNPDWRLGQIIWRRDPIESIAHVLAKSDVVGFSTYVWNHRYNYALAQRIKEINPNCLIVLGGPELAISDPMIFEKNPWMNIVIKMEGEITFSKVLRSSNLRDIPGLLINDNGKLIDTGDSERIEDLDLIPSPYLVGLFDGLISEHPEITWNATLETNRGCPYACTFCDWGSLTYNKVKKFSLDRVFAELEWIGKNCGYVTIADANLGMFVDRDSQIIDRLINVQKKYSRLTGYTMTWAKNQKNEVVELVKKLTDESPTYSGGLTVSVQSMDSQVLTNIKRKNLEQHKIKEIFDICNRNQLPAYTEIIMGLPGETVESWKNNFWHLFECGNHTGISILQAQLLENAEMNLLQRKLYKMETARILDYMSGTYEADGIDESVDMVISTSTMSRQEMLDTFVWNSFIQTFHISGLSTYISRYLQKKYGITYKDFYNILYNWVQADHWWNEEFINTRKYYEEWIAHGRVEHPIIGGIRLPGWNLHNRSILNVHFEQKIDHTINLLGKFLKTHYDIPFSEDLIQFQSLTVLDYSKMKQYPIIHPFKYDFYGYLLDDTDLMIDNVYKFDTKEDKKMSHQLFLESFWFGRKRNFGKTIITKL